MGSLLCPPLRGIYNNAEAFGSFMEAFTVCQARLQTRPRWFPQYQRLVSLIHSLMATCTQATYEAMQWKINPAEFIHVVRANEGAEAPAPGEAGDGHLRELLRGAATGSKDLRRHRGPGAHTKTTKCRGLSLRRTAPRLNIAMGADGFVDMSALLRAPRFWNEWVTEEEIIDVIHYNLKSRFEVRPVDGTYSVRALQGHSISHVRDDLILTKLSVEDTPEYAAHGTFYDFYESIARRGLMAGGLQGQSFRRHVHLVQELPWEGAISGMRSDCDMAIWIKTREAAAAGLTFYKSANAVLLTDTTIDPVFFHSVQILKSSEVLTAEGGPPNPQQVALAIFRAQARDTRARERYMTASLPSMRCNAAHGHLSTQHFCGICRTCCIAPVDGASRGGLGGDSRVRARKHKSCICKGKLQHLESGCTFQTVHASKLCMQGRHNCPKTPNKTRRIKTSAVQNLKKRRRRHHNREGCQIRAYAYLGLSMVVLLWIRFSSICEARALQMVQRLLVQPFSNFPLHHRKCRQRVWLTLPLRTGRESTDRPTAGRASPKGQYSRPGPKSGMGRALLILLLALHSQLSHGVRVPTHSVGVGEGSPQVHLSTRYTPKINGVQVEYGKQDPTHVWNKYVKRSFKRACHRAIKNGQASYKGKVLTVKQATGPATPRAAGQYTSTKHQGRRLRVFCYNVGGFGSGMYEDLMGFLDQSHYDVVLVQETKLRVDSEYVTANWICIGSGTESQKQAGVMVMIRKSITTAAEVRHDAIIPGRLLRVRFPLGNDGCKLSVVCAYQHAWNPKDAHILVKREEFWFKMSQCIGSIPYREHLVLGGDLNVQMTPLYPHVGHGAGSLSAERAPDTDAAHTVLSAHSLVALNTWGKHGSRAHTFTFGKHQAQLDYIIVRQRHSDTQARISHPIQNCPVGAWRQGGGVHKPVSATLPFHCKVFHKPPTRTPGIDAERIIHVAKQNDPEASAQLAGFRADIVEKIAPIQTVAEMGQLSPILSEVAARHFPKQRADARQVARWQQPEVQQGIKEMWKAWRLYKREDGQTRQVTLAAVLGRWRTWSTYYKLYRRHRERCRTTKKQHILEQMHIAEQAASSHNQRLLYQVVRSLAPKSKRGRPQLRDSGGRMMTRGEEAACFHAHFTGKFTTGSGAEDVPCGDYSAYCPVKQDNDNHSVPHLLPLALEDSLSHAPLRKAVPPGHPPSSIWRLCSDIVADKVCQVIDHQWTETSTVIPQPWSDAHLVLIRKPAKSGKEAGHYRPIGLQDQLGKLTFKALLEPHRELIYALVAK